MDMSWLLKDLHTPLQQSDCLRSSHTHLTWQLHLQPEVWAPQGWYFREEWFLGMSLFWQKTFSVECLLPHFPKANGVCLKQLFLLSCCSLQQPQSCSSGLLGWAQLLVGSPGGDKPFRGTQPRFTWACTTHTMCSTLLLPSQTAVSLNSCKMLSAIK